MIEDMGLGIYLSQQLGDAPPGSLVHDDFKKLAQ